MNGQEPAKLIMKYQAGVPRITKDQCQQHSSGCVTLPRFAFDWHCQCMLTLPPHARHTCTTPNHVGGLQPALRWLLIEGFAIQAHTISQCSRNFDYNVEHLVIARVLEISAFDLHAKSRPSIIFGHYHQLGSIGMSV